MGGAADLRSLDFPPADAELIARLSADPADAATPAPAAAPPAEG